MTNPEPLWNKIMREVIIKYQSMFINLSSFCFYDLKNSDFLIFYNAIFFIEVQILTYYLWLFRFKVDFLRVLFKCLKQDYCFWSWEQGFTIINSQVIYKNCFWKLWDCSISNVNNEKINSATFQELYYTPFQTVKNPT